MLLMKQILHVKNALIRSNFILIDKYVLVFVVASFFISQAKAQTCYSILASGGTNPAFTMGFADGNYASRNTVFLVFSTFLLQNNWHIQ
jgi:hypothetical protein